NGNLASTGVKFYANGANKSISSITSDNLSGTIRNGAPWIIGSDQSPTPGPMLGLIDDVRIYNRALSAAEIARLAAGNQPQTSTATITLGGAVTVNGDFSLNAGTLTASGNNITVAGNWWNN